MQREGPPADWRNGSSRRHSNFEPHYDIGEIFRNLMHVKIGNHAGCNYSIWTNIIILVSPYYFDNIRAVCM